MRDESIACPSCGMSYRVGEIVSQFRAGLFLFAWGRGRRDRPGSLAHEGAVTVSQKCRLRVKGCPCDEVGSTSWCTPDKLPTHRVAQWANKQHSARFGCSGKRCNVQPPGRPFKTAVHEDGEDHRCSDANLVPQSAWWRPALSLISIRSTRNLSVALPIAPSSQMGFIFFSPNRPIDRESDSGRSASYDTLHCALRVRTTPSEAVRGSRFAMPATVR
jgi:hypothetical protein